MRACSRVLLGAAATLLILPASAAQVVKIGAAHFPPYTIRPEKGADTGLLQVVVKHTPAGAPARSLVTVVAR